MKIKCPVCGIEHEYLYSHLLEHSSKSLADELHKLIFKIHEKIESLQNRMNEIDRNRGHYDEMQYQKYHEYQYELKSLLENEK